MNCKSVIEEQIEILQKLQLQQPMNAEAKCLIAKTITELTVILRDRFHFWSEPKEKKVL
jgi:hypothetical protein